jgi:cytochrome bd ubiquinol oxidase subunit II
VASAAAGLATLALVHRRRYELARYTAAVAVAAIVAGWGLAQAPRVLPGITISDAAASHDTLVALTIAVVAGGVVLFPALAALFRLTLAGRLGPGPAAPSPAAGPGARLPCERTAGRAAIACLVAGLGLLSIADAAWAHAVGVAALFAFGILGAGVLIAAGDPA